MDPNAPSFGQSFLRGLGGGLASQALGLVFGTAQSGLNTLINGSWRTHARFQRDMQKDLMNHQAELNRRQYDYEMQQESPVMQRARLESAGLNPALMYGSGAGGTGISASVGSVSGGSAGMPNPKAIQSTPVDLTQISDMELAASQARKNNAEAELLERETEAGGPEARVDLVKAQSELATSEAYDAQASARLNDLIRETKHLTQFYDVQFARSNWKLLDKRFDEIAANIRYLDATTGRINLLTPLEAKNTYMLGFKIGAETFLARESAYLAQRNWWTSYYQGEHYRESALGVSYDNFVKRGTLDETMQSIRLKLQEAEAKIANMKAITAQNQWQADHMWLNSIMQGASIVVNGLTSIGLPFIRGKVMKGFESFKRSLDPSGKIDHFRDQWSQIPWNTSVTNTLPDYSAPLWE